MTQPYQTITIETDKKGIAVLTINRPDKLNALNNDVMNDLEGALMKLRHDDDVKGIVVTGSGDKAFVAGADIKELAGLNNFTGTVLSERGQQIFARIEQLTKPVVAYVNGFALGGGCELAMACHLRVASENARFGLPEVTLGLIPGYGGTQRLTQLVGKGRAMELILTGLPVKADRALSIGLVNMVVSQEEGLTKTKELLETIMQRGPVAVAKAIEAVNAVFDKPGKGYLAEAEAFGALCGTKDFKEGTHAFLEKRSPSFNGN
ncbi:MAG: enoyl-CoA hydratase/isomerase family protein [Balneolales bacterium]|nr:enoyl-CoA hydratase/isomerase family protein [Balneolales bacterium]